PGAVNIRIIPRLDIKGPNLVKGICFEGLRVLGKPEDFARHYYEQGADELVYQDAVASLYGRNSLLDIVERTAREIFIPLAVGGGLRSLDDMRRVLRAGADKVVVNTAATKNPELIAEAARSFGSSTVVVAVEAMRMPGGGYEALVDYGRDRTGLDAVQWARRAAELGCGEIMLTAIHAEGGGKGFDLELTRAVADAVDVPVIAGGGAGSPEDVLAAVEAGHADAVALASLLHYNVLRDLDGAGRDYSTEGNTEFLKKGAGFSKVARTSLPEIKRHLAAHGLDMRLPAAAPEEALRA
ncbi:MAG: imidazole glycerol phosphate synthase subunit HisF, partial [Desulfovibrionaceae bacterium]